MKSSPYKQFLKYFTEIDYIYEQYLNCFIKVNEDNEFF